MSAFRRMLVFVIALAGLCTVATAQQLDQLAAARVLVQLVEPAHPLEGVAAHGKAERVEHARRAPLPITTGSAIEPDLSMTSARASEV